jgi:hypothetical protein
MLVVMHEKEEDKETARHGMAKKAREDEREPGKGRTRSRAHIHAHAPLIFFISLCLGFQLRRAIQ